MNTTCYEIKSVGFSNDCGEILDDSAGLQDFIEFFESEDSSTVVSFEEGLKELKTFVLDYGEKKDWKVIEKKLMKLKEEVGNEGVWKVWGVEYDLSLGVAL